MARWVEDATEDLLRLERFELALPRRSDNPDALLTGLDLVEAEELAQRGYAALRTQEAGTLIAESVEARDAALAREVERQRAVQVSESLRLASEAREAIRAEPETALLVAWEGLLWDRNELSETVFREAIRRLPAAVVVLRPPRDGTSKWISSGFAANGDAVFAVGVKDGIVESWRADDVAIGRFELPGGGGCAAVAAPGLRALVTYRAGVVRLHALDGEVLGEEPLEGAPQDADPLWDGISFRTASDVCFLRCAHRGWLLRIEPRLAGVRLVRALSFQAKGYDEMLHDPIGRVLGSALDGSGQRMLTFAHDRTTRIWAADGSLQAVLSDPEGADFASGEFLGDGSVVAGTWTGRGLLWDAGESECAVFKEPDGESADLFVRAVDSDGTHFATSVNRSGVVEVWNASGEQLAALSGHGEHAWSAAFSSDGRYLATGSADRTVRVWAWHEGHQLFELHGHTATVDRVSFHPSDANLLVSSGHDGAVRLWTLNAPPLPALRGCGSPAARRPSSQAPLVGSQPTICGANGALLPSTIRERFACGDCRSGPTVLPVAAARFRRSPPTRRRSVSSRSRATNLASCSGTTVARSSGRRQVGTSGRSSARTTRTSTHARRGSSRQRSIPMAMPLSPPQSTGWCGFGLRTALRVGASSRTTHRPTASSTSPSTRSATTSGRSAYSQDPEGRGPTTSSFRPTARRSHPASPTASSASGVSESSGGR
jgi:WD40 repeat protein